MNKLFIILLAALSFTSCGSSEEEQFEIIQDINSYNGTISIETEVNHGYYNIIYSNKIFVEDGKFRSNKLSEKIKAQEFIDIYTDVELNEETN